MIAFQGFSLQRACRLSLVVIVFGGLGLAGCGGTSKKAQAVAPSNPGRAGQATTDENGKQTAIDDAPSGGEQQERSQMKPSALSHYQRGMQQWRVGDLEGARTEFRQATQADPAAFQAFYSLGVIQERLGDKQALSSYRQASTLVATYEPAIVAYGLLLARNGNLSEADEYLSDRKARMPRSAAVLTGLAEVKSLRRDTGTAQRYAQDALKINPDFRPAMVTLARDHYRNRRLDLALYALKAILDGEDENNPPRDKNNAEAHLLRAMILKEQGRRALAIEELRKVVVLRPDLIEAKVQLAAYLLQSGNADEALPLLETSLRYKKDHLIAHLNLGDAFRLLGRTAEAQREFDWVITRDGSIPQSHYSVGLLYLFSSNIPGMDPKQQVAAAITSLERYQQLRGKPQPGSSDDSDQLLLRAKAKQGELSANEQAAKAAATASASGVTSSTPMIGSSAMPAGSSSARPGGS